VLRPWVQGKDPLLDPDGLTKTLLRHIDLLAEATPWQQLARPHYRVRVELPAKVVQGPATAAGTTQGLFVYIFPRDIQAAGGARYYAKLQDRSVLPKLMVL